MQTDPTAEVKPVAFPSLPAIGIGLGAVVAIIGALLFIPSVDHELPTINKTMSVDHLNFMPGALCMVTLGLLSVGISGSYLLHKDDPAIECLTEEQLKKAKKENKEHIIAVLCSAFIVAILMTCAIYCASSLDTDLVNPINNDVFVDEGSLYGMLGLGVGMAAVGTKGITSLFRIHQINKEIAEDELPSEVL